MSLYEQKAGMTGRGRRDWRGIGCAARIGAVLAFPAGIVIGTRGSSTGEVQVQDQNRPSGVRSRGSPGRDLYSPRVLTDPYVLEQQWKMVEALEANCRQFKRYCTEAEQARALANEAEARR